MTPTEKGMFCSKCNKEVFDFALKSKSDLARILDQNDKICGRFRKDHLDTDIYSLKRSKYSRLGFLLGLTTLFSISNPVYSQINCPEGIVYSKKQQEKKRDYLASRKVGDSIRIEGTITDGKMGLPGVLVRIKNQFKSESETDFEGKFSIYVPEKELRNNLILELLYIGYETQEVQINENTEYLNIILKEEDLLMGEVVIIREQNIFRKIGNLFKRNN